MRRPGEVYPVDRLADLELVVGGDGGVDGREEGGILGDGVGNVRGGGAGVSRPSFPPHHAASGLGRGRCRCFLDQGRSGRGVGASVVTHIDAS